MRALLAVCSSLAFAASVLFAQAPAHPAKAHTAQAAPAAALPITRVALYKSGVGFFEHTGRVTGNETVTIDLTSAQLNDVLQSLTAIDLGGGRIVGAGYNSTTPLDQQLKTLPLALTADPSDVDFYEAIRGAPVQVSGAGAAFTGRLLSIDLRQPSAPNDRSTNAQQAASRRFLTVVAESGAVRTVELAPGVTVTLLDSALHTDVTHYLELLAANRSDGLRHLTLTDRGPGSRELRVSYISDVPVWKSTYRILFTGDATAATLQGWSVVDNTTGSDWINVHLDLIAGAPQSFIQPLSTPYYARRPKVPLPQEAQLTPQTHESGEEDKVSQGGVTMSRGSTGGALGGLASGAGQGIGPGYVGVGGGVKREAGDVSVDEISGKLLPIEARSLSLNSVQPLPQAPVDYQLAASRSLTPQTSTSSFDDFFEYTLTDPITIRKNESALVPILQTHLPVERVTLWAQQEPIALRALWITNASNLTLDRGSFSIVENGSFGGEGLTDPIHPGEKRLLSYAADQAVRVTQDRSNDTQSITHVSVRHGVFYESTSDLSEVTYTIHNAAPETRTVILEQPLRQGWTLTSDAKPAETTPSAYRFRVVARSQATEHLRVAEQRTYVQQIRLVDRSEDQLLLLFKNAKISPELPAELQPVFDLHHQVVALDMQIKNKNDESTAIGKDQDRLRQNLSALKGTPEEKALATRYTGELNAQEDRLAALHTEIDQLKMQRAAADAEFNAKLDAVNFDKNL